MYVYFEDYKRAAYQEGFDFRGSHNADEFWYSKMLDAYENHAILTCGAGTFSDKPDGCIYGDKDIGGRYDPESEFNLKVLNYYMQN